jgi:hypothetical protein
MSNQGHDGHDSGEKGYDPDVGNKQMLTVGIYFVVLATAFFSSLGGLFLFFRYEADQELDRKAAHNNAQTEQVRAVDTAAVTAAASKLDAAMQQAVKDLNK